MFAEDSILNRGSPSELVTPLLWAPQGSPWLPDPGGHWVAQTGVTLCLWKPDDLPLRGPWPWSILHFSKPFVDSVWPRRPWSWSPRVTQGPPRWPVGSWWDPFSRMCLPWHTSTVWQHRGSCENWLIIIWPVCEWAIQVTLCWHRARSKVVGNPSVSVVRHNVLSGHLCSGRNLVDVAQDCNRAVRWPTHLRNSVADDTRWPISTVHTDKHITTVKINTTCHDIPASNLQIKANLCTPATVIIAGWCK